MNKPRPMFALTGYCRPDPTVGGKCPSCLGPMPLYLGAISRRDNKTEICSSCGAFEAASDLYRSTGDLMFTELLKLKENE